MCPEAGSSAAPAIGTVHDNKTAGTALRLVLPTLLELKNSQPRSVSESERRQAEMLPSELAACRLSSAPKKARHCTSGPGFDSSMKILMASSLVFYLAAASSDIRIAGSTMRSQFLSM